MKDLLADLRQAFVVVFFALSAFFLYDFLFYLTKPSPLSQAGSLDNLVALAGLFGIVGLFAAVVAALSVLAPRALPRGPAVSRGFVSIIVLFISVSTALLFLENFSYTFLKKVSLQNTDHWGIKIVFAIASIAAGRAWSRFIFRQSSRLGDKAGWAIALLLAFPIAYLFFGGWNGAQSGLSAAQAATIRPNIVILSSDGIDAERMSVYGYSRKTTPFLDSKAGEFAIFDRAFTNNGNTTGSIVSLLTGMRPTTTQVVYPPDILQGLNAFRSLPRLLGPLGYYRSNWAVPHYSDAWDQNVLEAFDQHNDEMITAFLNELVPVADGLTRWIFLAHVREWARVLLDVTFVKEMDNRFAQIKGGGNTLRDSRRLQGVLDDLSRKRPVFINTHFMVTHGPFFLPETRFFSLAKKQASEWNVDFYDDAVRDFDNAVERVYRHLEEIDELDNTILVVTSDHGILYDASKRIPLLIRFPGQDLTGRFVKNVQRIDVAPTILDYMGLETLPWMEGNSLLEIETIPPDRLIVAANIKAKRPDRVAGGWVHDGAQEIGEGHQITAIYCDAAFVFVPPRQLVSASDVPGPNGGCHADLKADAELVTGLLERLLSTQPTLSEIR